MKISIIHDSIVFDLEQDDIRRVAAGETTVGEIVNEAFVRSGLDISLTTAYRLHIVSSDRHDHRTGNIILCVSSDSVPEYTAFMKITEQSAPTLGEGLTIGGVDVSDIPAIFAAFDSSGNFPPNDQNRIAKEPMD